MNKLVLYTLFAVAGLISFASCKKNNFVIGKNIVPNAYVKFSTALEGDTVSSYFIKSTNDPFVIPVGITNVSEKDRTIHFTITSPSATAGQEYSAPTSLVIPAGEAVASLVVKGNYDAYTVPGQIDTLNIAISGGDVAASPYKTHYTLYLRKYCDVNLDDFLGDYTRSRDQQGSGNFTDNYTATITSYTSTGPTSASLIVYNYGNPMFGAPYNPTDLAVNPGITLHIDWADPSNFKVTVPTQAIAAGYYGPNGLIKNVAGGTFSSCANTFTIKYNFAIGSSNYGTFTTILER